MLNIKEIKNLISLREEYWENSFTTNCYAFALGLDIPEDEICKKGFQPGVMASSILNIPFNQIAELKIENRVILDFKALKLGYKISELEDKQELIFLGNYICQSWDILLFSKDEAFHFARVNINGEMYHKIGYFGVPQKTSISEIEKSGYSFLKRYRLRYWEKQ